MAEAPVRPKDRIAAVRAANIANPKNRNDAEFQAKPGKKRKKK